MNHCLSRKPVALLVAPLFISVSAPALAIDNNDQGTQENVSVVNLQNIVNSITSIKNGEFYNGAVAMGWGASANVSNNTLNVNNINVTDSAPAEVNFTGGRIHKPHDKQVNNGQSGTITAKKGFLNNVANHNTVNFNSVTSNSGSKLVRVTGGFILLSDVIPTEDTKTGEANFNTVTMSGSHLENAEVLGADIQTDVYETDSGWGQNLKASATANENSVKVTQSEFGTAYIAGASTDAETATVNKNSVLLDGVTIKNGLTSFIDPHNQIRISCASGFLLFCRKGIN